MAVHAPATMANHPIAVAEPASLVRFARTVGIPDAYSRVEKEEENVNSL